MSLYRLLAPDPPEALRPGRVIGVVTAEVSNDQDPDALGRVKVKYPWLTADGESEWIPVATCGAGAGHGLLLLPRVGDHVLVLCEHGDLTRAYVIATVWSSVTKPPTADGDGLDRKVFRSRSGHVVRIDDTSGGEKIEIVDSTGKNTVTIDSTANSVTVVSEKDIVLKAPKGAVRIEAKELAIATTGEAKLEASATMTIKGATINLN